MNIHKNHLSRLAVILLIIHLVQCTGVIFAHAWILERYPDLKLSYVILESVLALCLSGIAFLLTRHEAWVKYTLIPSMVMFIILAVLLVYDNKTDLDSLVDITLLLTGLVIYLQFAVFTRYRKLERISRKKPFTLDLRIADTGELFNPLVMSPHLEINEGITGAVDRFLRTSSHDAPLCLCIHSSASISKSLQDTMTEVFRAHYEDEERRVDRQLEKLYSRSIVLILVSVAALKLINVFSGKSAGEMVWLILSNFAAFSLWQIGSTYFERNAVLTDLIHIRIAHDSRITFE